MYRITGCKPSFSLVPYFVLKEFKVGRPQVFAGGLLLLFLIQCLWVSAARRLSDLEYEYIASGFRARGQATGPTSPLTGLIAASPVRLVSALKSVSPGSLRSVLAIPHPWFLRLPFVICGLWLGGALWWVARRLFGDGGGYVALALYCFSPAMVEIGSNVGPEVILAWSSFGLLYTAIGVAHTVYAPPRKWIPRIVILGIAIGVCLSTALWSVTFVLLAFTFMLYLSPGRRRAAAVVLLGATAIGTGIFALVGWIAASGIFAPGALLRPQLSLRIFLNLGFLFADAFPLPDQAWITTAQEMVLGALVVGALTVYGSWDRARYFGNTAPLITSFATVLMFSLAPAIHIWEAPLGLSFLFLFIGGIAADLLETPYRRILSFVLYAILFMKSVLGMSLLRGWIHQNSV
jgi:Dolichyl-phosphate-mannose-protein mannosyltransferase